MKDIVVEVNKLRKVYGDSVAVDNISFDVRKGEIFVLLGPNGSGKTTTLECLEGLRKPDGGSVKLMGLNPNYNYSNLCNLIGVQLQTSGLPGNIRVDEAMNFFCAYHNKSPRYDLLERLGFKEKMDAQYQTLSTVQQRRLALALSIAHSPSILILDEPTADLDDQSRVELHDIIIESQKRNTTILLATHNMAEAAKLATRMAILWRGKMITAGTPLEVTATGARLAKISVRIVGSSLSKPDIKFPSVTKSLLKDEYKIYYSTNPGLTVSAIIKYISKQKDELIDLRVERSLEERFMEITDNEAKK
ncbi:MAG: ABC transporter ATP-binding protein [Candidatus Hydromicrobium sp.]